MNEPAPTQKEEVDANYAFFEKKLPELLPDYRGKFALLHKCKILGFFDTRRDALEAARMLGKEVFSVQKVSNEVEDIGYFSHVACVV